MKTIAFLAAALMLCGCLTSQTQETPDNASLSNQSDYCQAISDHNAADDCYRDKAKSGKDAGMCEKIGDAAKKSECMLQISLDSAIQTTTTTIETTITATTETTTTTEETTTTLSTPENPYTVAYCISKNTNHDPDSVFYAYSRGCGSKYLPDVSAIAIQTGANIIPLDIQAAAADNDLKVLECFFGPYSKDNKDYRICPRILCPKTGTADTIGETTTSSTKTQITKSVKNCLNLAGTPETGPEAAGDTTTTTEPTAAQPADAAGACNSTNPDQNLYVKGVTTGKNGQKTDICVISEKYPSHDRIRKYYCTPDGAVAAAEYNCPLSCMDGACVNYMLR